MPPTAALGFRVKSGWAASVLLGGSAELPSVIERRIVQLSDPVVPASRQPYHAAMGVAREASPELDRLVASVRATTQRSIDELLEAIRSSGYFVCGAGVVTGSNVDPDQIGNPHVRAHACEGRLFRTAVENALRTRTLTCTTFLEREVFARAVTVLCRPEAELKRMLTGVGRGLGGPWRRDEKLATAAAWMMLAGARWGALQESTGSPHQSGSAR